MTTATRGLCRYVSLILICGTLMGSISCNARNSSSVLPVWELSARHDSDDYWREMVVQRQGKQERIAFRSVPKDSRVGWLYSVYLHGPQELKEFRNVLKKFHEIIRLSETDLFANRKQQLGSTSQHEFWLNFHGQEPVLDYTDPKNHGRAGMTMLGQDTVEHFTQLSTEYELITRLLDELRDGKAKPSSTAEQVSRGRGEGKAATGVDTRSSQSGGNAGTPRQQQAGKAGTKPNLKAPAAGQSADYRRGWEETYEGGKRWGEMRRRSPSPQLDGVIEQQLTALRSTVESLEEIGHQGEAYDLSKGRLDGFLAGLSE